MKHSVVSLSKHSVVFLSKHSVVFLSKHSVVSLSKILYPLLSTGSTQEISQHD